MLDMQLMHQHLCHAMMKAALQVAAAFQLDLHHHSVTTRQLVLRTAYFEFDSLTMAGCWLSSALPSMHFIMLLHLSSAELKLATPDLDKGAKGLGRLPNWDSQ